jgi:curved DNA-binding protein CbpA
VLTKDYYSILQISPQASLQDIKQAYRKLAKQYHPDKNANDPGAAAQFSQVKEAYEVLTNPDKKEKYLQERWYNDSLGRKRTSPVITPVNVLRECLDLERYVSTLDTHRMNHEGLYEYIRELFSDDTMAILQQSADASINRQIITTSLAAIKPLKYHFARLLIPGMLKLAGNDNVSVEKIQQYQQFRIKKEFFEKYKIVLIILATALICLLIFITSK